MTAKMKKKHAKKISLSAVLFCTSLALAAVSFAGYKVNDWIHPAKDQNQMGDVKETGKKSFTFVGVGDNLIHGAIYLAYPNNGIGADFSDLFENTNSYTQKADLAYINAETMMAAETAEELSSYPTFNGPVSYLGAIDKAGFDWISMASNHSMDTGSTGIFFEIDELNENYPNIAHTGSYKSEKDSKTPVVKDINGIKVGLANFTYGTNGIPLPEEYPWLIDVWQKEDGSIDYDAIKTKIDALKKASDVQIVAMHWGQEYMNEPDDLQKELVKYLNELGVEVIIGAHPHVIQTVELYEGPKQNTLVYYSLGNFISAQDEPERMIGGMASFELTYDFNNKKTSFENVEFIPTITWFNSDYSSFKTYAMPEYNDELASTHRLSAVDGKDISKEFVSEYVTTVVGEPEGVKVVKE